MDHTTRRPRVTKDPEERREELVSTAAMLFARQGFSRTTVGDIVHSLGVAQGTFYYYFKSKEDIFLAIFEGHLRKLLEGLRPAAKDTKAKDTKAKDTSTGAIEKLNNLIWGLLTKSVWREDDPLLRELHRPENAGLHQKVAAKTVRILAPLFADVIEQGINEGAFRVPQPTEMAEFALSGSLFWLDPLIFDWTQEELGARVKTLPRILEQLLEVKEGSIVIPESWAQREAHCERTREGSEEPR